MVHLPAGPSLQPLYFFLFQIVNFNVYECLPKYMYLHHVHAGAYRDHKLDPLELEL